MSPLSHRAVWARCRHRSCRLEAGTNTVKLCERCQENLKEVNGHEREQQQTEAFGANSEDVSGNKLVRTRTTGSESANFAVSAHRRNRKRNMKAFLRVALPIQDLWSDAQSDTRTQEHQEKHDRLRKGVSTFMSFKPSEPTKSISLSKWHAAGRRKGPIRQRTTYEHHNQRDQKRYPCLIHTQTHASKQSSHQLCA